MDGLPARNETGDTLMAFDEATVDKAISTILHLASGKDWHIQRLVPTQSMFPAESISINGTLFVGDSATLMNQAFDQMLGDLGYVQQAGETTLTVTQKGKEAWSIRKDSFETDEDDYENDECVS